MRRCVAVELERRRKDGPVVVDAGVDAVGLPRADVTVPASNGSGEDAVGAERVLEAVWRAYRRQLLG
jgi:hypothetical protein